jgi:diguanylate cyclase (GGDEF)-like protein/PAS domain S-box-containing protein
MACVAVISTLAVAGWVFTLPILASLRPDYIPMAPATALLFLGLCLAWMIRSVFPARQTLRKFVQAGLLGLLLIVILLALRYLTGSGPDLEKLLYPNPPLFDQFISARMSPLAALGFFLAIPAMLLMNAGTPGMLKVQVAVALSLILFILSGIMCLGYLYGAPLFYGGTLTPVAITTAYSFWFFSLGLLMMAGPTCWPLRVFAGDSLKARLMRTFIPATLFIVVLQGLLSSVAGPLTIGPAIKVGIAVFVACLVVILTVSVMANALSVDFERGRQAELALKQSEFMFRALFESSPDSVMLIDPVDSNVSWPIIDCNKAGCLMNGYRRDELIGHSIDILNLTEGTPAERSAYLKKLRAVGNLQLETFHRNKNGTIFPIEVSTTLIQVGGRELVMGIDRDITARKQAEETLSKTEQIYRQAITHAGGVPYQRYYANEAYVFLGEGFESLTGYSPAEMTGAFFATRLRQFEAFDDHADLSHEKYVQLARQGGVDEWREDFLFERKDGTLVWLADHSVQIRDAAGKVTGSLGILMDISERKQAEAARRQSEAELRALFASMQDVVLVIDRLGRYREIAPTNPGLLVRAPKELLGKTLQEVFRPEQAQIFLDVNHQVLESGQTAQIEYDLLIGGQSIWFQASISPMTEDSTLWVAHDITRRKHMEQEIRNLSLTDELTGLHNRRGFTLLAEQELRLARRFKRGLLLLFGDLDHLKAINDTWGHAQGDLALVEMAAVLKETFREADIPARFGGDEFVVLAVDVALESADTLTKRLQSVLERHNQSCSRSWQLSISLGIASYDSAAPCTLTELISQADALMYTQKQTRQGRV